MIILDFGSGETCKNDISYIKRMINELRDVDGGHHRIVIKWQLFAPETVPLMPVAIEPLSLLSFDEAYRYAAMLGYETTASVFDKWSLSKLLQYEVPFVKLACRGWVYPLLGVPRIVDVPPAPRVVVSVADAQTGAMLNAQWDVDALCCVPEYPANAADYWAFGGEALHRGISDHTETWELYDEYEPDIYECHYRLEDSTGPDAASFARTPETLREVL